MRKSSYARKPFFISLQNEQTPEFVTVLAKQIQMEIPVITPATLMQADPNHRNRILLIDHQQHKVLLREIKNLPLIWKGFETVLCNVPNRLTTEETDWLWPVQSDLLPRHNHGRHDQRTKFGD